MVAELARIDGEHITLPVAAKNPLTAWKRAGLLAKTLQQERVDLLHYRSRVPGWLSLLARRKLHQRGYILPVLSTYHGIYPAQNAMKRYYNSVMVRGDHTIAVSRAVADWIRGQHPDFDAQNMTVIPRGCDLSAFTAKPANPDWRSEMGLDLNAPILMQVGRLSSLKGAAFMARALIQLRDLPWQFVLVGEDAAYPEEVARITQTFENAGVRNRLHFLGVQRDMARLYPQADILLCGAQHPEAFGRTIIEAAACGVPALVPDQGGTAEVVVDGITGWHYRFCDGDHAGCVLRSVLMQNETRRRAIGQAAQARVQRYYRLEAMQQATLEVYQRLLDTKRQDRYRA